MSEREELQKSLAALEAQRETLGEAVVGPAITALREKLASLEAQPPALHNQTIGGGKRQRKLVTVLFADLVNFTAIAEHMDPEDVQSLIKTYFERWKQIIEQFGGSVEKFIGDAVMAVWGAQTAREDDAESAIRASLMMREALRTEAWSLEVSNRQRDENPFLASGLHMRVGINTGLVLVGELAENAQFTIIGDTVNTASRLEHAAPVDGVLITHDTYRHVTGVFEVQPVEPLALKGKSEPVQTFLVFQAHPQTFRSGTRGVEGIQTRMVGRESELEVLQNTWAAVSGMDFPGKAPDLQVGEAGFGTFRIDHRAADEHSHRARAVTVVGDAGLGKSRLLFEFQNWIETTPCFYYRFQVRAVEQITEMPYALLRYLFALRFQIQESDGPAVARQKLEEGFLQFFGQGDQEKVHFIGHVLGYDYSASPYLRGILADFKQICDRATIYLVEYFSAAASCQPVVIYLEDIHWADENSLDLLRQIQDAINDKPLFILALTRPTLFDRYPQWGQGLMKHQFLALKPLNKNDTYALIEDILRKVRYIPPALRDLVADEAEGNPFYIEELIKMLIEEGVILKDETSNQEKRGWRVVTERLTRLHVPPTLTGVLQARLDALPEMERETLQVASVIGRVFWAEAVRSLMLNSPSGELRYHANRVESILRALNEHELIFQRRSSTFALTEEYVFKHSILHEVTYETVLRSDRRIYHGAMARWLAGQGGERADEYAGLIASHFEKADEMALAGGWYYRAGRLAAAQYAGQDAVAHLSKALDFTPVGMCEERYLILRERLAVYDLSGNREAQEVDLELLTDLAERLGDVERRAEVAILSANLFEVLGNYLYAQTAAQNAIRLVEEQPEFCHSTAGQLRLAESYMAWGVASMRSEDYPKAHDSLQRALYLAREIPPDVLLLSRAARLQADALRHLGNLFYFQNNTSAGYTCHNQALELYQKMGDLRGESYALVSLGVLAIQANQLSEAIDYQERGLKVSERIGDQLGQARALNNLGDIYAQMGDYERALPDLVFSYEIFERINHRHGKVVALANLQDVYTRLGKFDQALTCNRKWMEIVRLLDDHLAQALAYEGAAHFYLWVGDFSRAKIELERAEEIIIKLGEPNRVAGLHFLQAEWNLRIGEVQSAIQAAQNALELARAGSDRHLQAQLLTVLGLALTNAGQFEPARSTHQEGEKIHLETGFSGRAVESHLYQGAALLAAGDPAQALEYVQQFIDYEANSPLGLLEDPFGDFWVVYQILQANRDTRAQIVLSRAHSLLMARAQQIHDADLRRCYMELMPAHRAIQLEWDAEMR